MVARVHGDSDAIGLRNLLIGLAEKGHRLFLACEDHHIVTNNLVATPEQAGDAAGLDVDVNGLVVHQLPALGGMFVEHRLELDLDRAPFGATGECMFQLRAKMNNLVSLHGEMWKKIKEARTDAEATTAPPCVSVLYHGLRE